MREIQKFILDPNVPVSLKSHHVRDVPSFLEEEVNRIWKKRKERHFVDTPIVSLVHYEPSHLRGELVWFRALYAARSSHLLRTALDIHPLGISGRLFADSHVLLGKRAKHLLFFPGALECCPSGHIDVSSLLPDGSIDIQKALMKELEEETHMAPECVRSVQVRGLYWDMSTGVWDIHCDLIIDKQMTLVPTQEYTEFIWVPLHKALSLARSGSVPLSRELLCVPRPDMLVGHHK